MRIRRFVVRCNLDGKPAKYVRETDNGSAVTAKDVLKQYPTATDVSICELPVTRMFTIRAYGPMGEYVRHYTTVDGTEPTKSHCINMCLKKGLVFRSITEVKVKRTQSFSDEEL